MTQITMRLGLACLLGLMWALTSGPAHARTATRASDHEINAAAGRDANRAAAKKKKTKKNKTRAQKGKAKDAPAPATETGSAAEPVAVPAPPVAPQPPGAGPAPAANPDTGVLPAAPPLPTKYRAVALFPVRSLEVGAELVQATERSLLNEIDELGGLRSVSPSDVTNDLAQYPLDPGACGGDVKCLAQAGRYARAHWALETRLASLGGTLTVSLRLVDTQSGTELGRVAEPLSDNPDERAQELHRFAIQLLASETYVGTLIVRTSVEGAEVYLDDRLVGTTPLPAPLTNLRAGPHIMRLAKSGYADIYQFVDVVYKRVSTIKADLESNVVAGVIVEAESATGFGQLFVAGTEAGIEVRIDGEPRGTTVLAAPIDKVAAGKRRVSLRKAGATPVVHEVQIEKDKRTDVAVSLYDGMLMVGQVTVVKASAPLPQLGWGLAAGPQGPGSLGAPASRWKLWSGAVAAGLGVLSLAASAYYGNQVSNAKSRRDAILKQVRNGVSAEAWTKLNGELTGDVNPRGRRATTAHVVTLSAGAVLAAAGGALLYWQWVSPSAGASLALVPAAGGAQVLAGMRW